MKRGLQITICFEKMGICPCPDVSDFKLGSAKMSVGNFRCCRYNNECIPLKKETLNVVTTKILLRGKADKPKFLY